MTLPPPSQKALNRIESAPLSQAPRPFSLRRALRWVLNDLGDAHRARRSLRNRSAAEPGRYVVPDEFFARKRSDTLFILGSGRSVLSLGREAWDLIGAADSLGFNFWMLHDFVPTFFMFEPAKTPEREEAFLTALARRAHDYRHVLFLADARHDGQRIYHFPAPLRDRLHLYAPYYLPVDSPAVVAAALRWWGRGVALGLVGLEHSIHHRSSLSAAIAFGLLAGYRSIVLVGVDLNTAGHFYDGFPGAPVDPANRPMHATADPARAVRRLTIDTYLDLFEQLVLRPRGVRLHLAHDHSRLYPRHPIYPSLVGLDAAAPAGAGAARS